MSDVEDLVRRTLAEVAGLLEVPAGPPSSLPEPALGRPSRPGRSRIAVVAAAAAALVVGVSVWALQRPGDEGSTGTWSDERLRPAGPDTPGAGWLPEGIGRDGTASEAEEALTTGVTAVLGTDRSDGGVVIAVEGESFTQVRRVAARAGAYLGAPTTAPLPDPDMTMGVTPDGRTRAFVVRGGTAAGASDLGPALARGDLDLAPAVESAGGGRASPVDLSWLPMLGATVGTLYEGEDTEPGELNVELKAVGGDLPPSDVVAAVLGSDTLVDVAGSPATLVPGNSAPGLVFQAAPGVVGVVGGRGVTVGDLVQVAAEAEWPAQVSGAPPARCAAPADDTARTTGSIGVTSAGDLPYELAAWTGPFAASGTALACASLDVAGATVGLGYDRGVLAPLSAATAYTGPGEAVLLVAYAEGTVLFTGRGVSTQGIDVEAPRGVDLTFIHVDAEGRTGPVPVEVVDTDGAPLLTLYVGVPPGGTAGNDTN